MIIVVGYC